MIIQPEFLTHWKVQALSGAIGRLEAITSLLALWGHCQTSKSYVHRLTPEKLAGVCQYLGDPAHLLTTFLKLDLLDPLESGEFEVHGWAEKNYAFTKNWENGGKGGRPAKSANQNQSTTLKNPRAVSENPESVWVNPAGNPNANSGNPSSKSVNPAETEGIEGLEGGERRERLEKKKEGMGPVGPPTSLIFWNLASGWTGFTPELRRTLQNAFPRVDLDLACVEADLWLRKNPANADKKNWLKFLTNWLTTSSPSGHGNYGGTRQEYLQKNEEGAPPPAQLVRPAPAAPWRAAFAATYGRPPDTAWPNLPPGIQREIKDILAAADPLQLHVWAAQENEGGAAA